MSCLLLLNVLFLYNGVDRLSLPFSFQDGKNFLLYYKGRKTFRGNKNHAVYSLLKELSK